MNITIRKITYLTSFAFLFGLALCTGCHKNQFITPSWDQCTLSSNWHGANASQRMMNILSPHMPDAVFDQRVNFIKSRGCNCVHLILCNKSDGEYGGYSIYGNGISWTVNKAYTDVMTKRIKKLRKEGFGIVLWLTTDDSTAWNRTLAGNFPKYVSDIKSLGWFSHASTVVLGLEMDEYWSAAQAASAAQALKGVYKGKIGVHLTSGRYDWANIADILFYQTAPGKNASQIKSECTKVKKAVNKPVNFFELSRTEDRNLSKAAMEGGAYGVGNW